MEGTTVPTGIKLNLGKQNMKPGLGLTGNKEMLKKSSGNGLAGDHYPRTLWRDG